MHRESIIFALGSLVFGLLGLSLSLFWFGAVFASAGVVMGCWHLLRGAKGHDMAIAGTSIALSGLLFCVIFAGVNRFNDMNTAREAMKGEVRAELAETGSALDFGRIGQGMLVLSE